MDSSKIQRQIINLGNLLVEELKREDKYPDTLTRWMAHYIAEQIIAAESAEVPDKAAAQERCFQTILALWKHRSSMPSGHRPFESFEPILRALEHLDPKASRAPSYGIPSLSDTPSKSEPSSVKVLMEFVPRIDLVARELINVAITEAARKATSPQTLALLNAAIPSTGDIDIVRRLVIKGEDELSAGEDKKKVLKKQLEETICNLDAFCTISAKIREYFEGRLNRMSPKSA